MNDIKFYNFAWMIPIVIFGSVGVAMIFSWVVSKIEEWFNGGDD